MDRDGLPIVGSGIDYTTVSIVTITGVASTNIWQSFYVSVICTQ